MPNMPHRFLDRDVKRVIKIMRQAGFAITSVEVDPKSGRIVAGVREVTAPVQDNEKAATA
jgi:hypothetical protein